MIDHIGRRLRAARPRTIADDDWAASPDGDRALAAIRRAVAEAPTGSGLRMRVLLLPPSARRRPIAYGLAATAVVAAVAIGLAVSPGRHTAPPAAPIGQPPAPVAIGPRPHDLALAAYTDCAAMLAGLRAHTAAHVTANGLNEPQLRYPYEKTADGALLGQAALTPSPAARSTGGTSTTNDQEIGADEPDLVKTDGDRVVSVSGGVLRVVDATTHKVTGQLDLSVYAGADQAQLLVSGNRALVILGGGSSAGGPYPDLAPAGDYGYPVTPGTGLLLVSLTKAPSVISVMHPKGSYVDARLIGGTVRLVVQSGPTIRFPVVKGSAKTRSSANKDVARHAPLSSWLPSYDVTSGGTTTTHTVGCAQVRHPVSYTGTSMLTVYSIDPAAGFGNVAPVSLAADGATVYATTSSLYVASQPATAKGSAAQTQLHRFDITRPGRPTYLGSGTVPGRLLSSYSLSDYAGHLRVVTTGGGGSKTSSAVYVLDAATLKTTGHVGGLGRGQQIYAVRFVAAQAYVVTYRSVDPLYVLDLADPTHPRTAGELHISGYSTYLHPTSAGRLLGVGEAVAHNRVAGLQVSLFDVADPARPTRIARIVQPRSPDESTLDPHAFLYWPATGTAVVPIQSWDARTSGGVLVVHVGTGGLRSVGTIRNPTTTGNAGYGTGIERTLVVDGAIWTMSPDGIAVSDLTTLHRASWIPFS